MNKYKITIDELLSETSVEKLEAALSKGNMENLKKEMGRLFSFKNIFNLHDDHLSELAECIIDAANEDDLTAWARHTESYARKRMTRYQARKKAILEENQWAKAAKTVDELTMMDLKYRLWIYEHGFEYSRYHMNKILCHMMQDIQKREEQR